MTEPRVRYNADTEEARHKERVTIYYHKDHRSTCVCANCRKARKDMSAAWKEGRVVKFIARPKEKVDKIESDDAYDGPMP